MARHKWIAGLQPALKLTLLHHTGIRFRQRARIQLAAESQPFILRAQAGNDFSCVIGSGSCFVNFADVAGAMALTAPADQPIIFSLEIPLFRFTVRLQQPGQLYDIL